MNILICDDSPVTLKFLQRVLEEWGHSVTLSKDGREAWDIIQQENSPKLCILDWDMPVMSGLEVCKKTRVRGLDRYIILLTAKNDVLDIEEGLGMGVDDYITKPFRKEELDIRIRAAMRILHLEKILKMPHNQTVSEKIAL